jgi:hypothetical protein
MEALMQQAYDATWIAIAILFALPIGALMWRWRRRQSLPALPLVCLGEHTSHCLHADGVVMAEVREGSCWRVSAPYRPYSCCRPGCLHVERVRVALCNAGSWVEL